MGKSPGKWIKTVLFGKKSSKANLSKARKDTEKKTAFNAPGQDLVADLTVESNLSSQSVDRGIETAEFGNDAADVPSTAANLPAAQGVDSPGTMGIISVDDAEASRLDQAATKTQAAFRGFLARRAFRALKGIIRLQALIRGHLVRRQAVATLRCMQSIVKLQLLARGKKDAKRVDLFCKNTFRPGRLAKNAFVLKLLKSVPNAMPLSLQYDPLEPNSAWNWLERWSSSHFWEPLPVRKKLPDAKSQKKQASMQVVDAETGRPKRSVRKVPPAGDNGVNSSETEKPKRNARKVINHQAEPMQEQPQNELERVKRSLRKVSAATTKVSEKLDTETETSRESPTKLSKSAPPDLMEQSITAPVEKVGDSVVEVDQDEHKPAVSEAPLKSLTVDEPVAIEAPSEPVAVEAPSEQVPPELVAPPEPVDLSHEDPSFDQHSPENLVQFEFNPKVNDEFNSKEDQISQENQRARRKSLPMKPDQPENASQTRQSLPSYMQATESAKAKLRAQGSLKLEEGSENGSIRRHSLPSSTNGKLSSVSPRMQKVHSNGKGGSRSSKALSSSKDDKTLQPGWRR